jgi:cell fate regulator YaaT (PSP1 superfamily)
LAHLIEVAFRGNRKEFFLWDYPDLPALKSPVIVDADRGEDFGHVHSVGELAQKRNGGCAHGCGTSAPVRKALRIANAKDTAAASDLTRQNDEVRRKAMDRVRANNLGMKITDAEWQWDRKKLTFYFTAEKRVDFRNLVRDLASLFRTRIELKQIGVRDEARRLDGVGRCGRQYCSASWLPELRPVNLGVAKDQKLSLNPSQISGACGRLMCSLRYEHEFYAQARRKFPKEGRPVTTQKGEEMVVSNDIFRELVTLRSLEGELRVLRLNELQREMGVPETVELPVVTGEYTTSEDEIHPEDISPELQYTSEHAIPVLPLSLSVDSSGRGATGEIPAVSLEGPKNQRQEEKSPEDKGGQRNRRRRGKRGGRRGRGGAPGDGGSGPASPGGA